MCGQGNHASKSAYFVKADTTINELISIFLRDKEVQDLIPVVEEDNKLLECCHHGDIL